MLLDDNFASGFFPDENVVVTVDGSKFTESSSSSAIGLASDVSGLGYQTCYVSHFCGLSRMDPSVANVSLCCSAMDETTSHIVRFPSQGWISLFHNSVRELVGWLEEVDTDPFLVVIIQTFLLGRGELI